MQDLSPHTPDTEIEEGEKGETTTEAAEEAGAKVSTPNTLTKGKGKAKETLNGTTRRRLPLSITPSYLRPDPRHLY